MRKIEICYGCEVGGGNEEKMQRERGGVAVEICRKNKIGLLEKGAYNKKRR